LKFEFSGAASICTDHRGQLHIGLTAKPSSAASQVSNYLVGISG
jgi:hypothetical protein